MVHIHTQVLHTFLMVFLSLLSLKVCKQKFLHSCYIGLHERCSVFQLPCNLANNRLLQLLHRRQWHSFLQMSTNFIDRFSMISRARRGFPPYHVTVKVSR